MAIQAPENNEAQLYRYAASFEQLDHMRYAYSVSEGDLRFVALLEAENQQWTHDRVHNLRYSLCWNWSAWEAKRPPNQEFSIPKCQSGEEGWFWRIHDDHGFCGISDGYYKYIVDDPRFYTNPKWQIEQCNILWKGGTRFYGADNIPTTIKRFYFE